MTYLDGAAGLATDVRIVLVDDHLVVAQGIERLLIECFSHVDVIASGEAPVESVLRDPPDLVIADITMPGVSGIEALTLLRVRGCLTSLIFLTMHADPRLTVAALDAGARGFVPKSSAGEELVRAVREVLEGKTYVRSSVSAGAMLYSARPQCVWPGPNV